MDIDGLIAELWMSTERVVSHGVTKHITFVICLQLFEVLKVKEELL